MSSNEMRGDYEAVKQDVNNLKNDTSAMAGHARERSTESINSALGRIEDTVSEIWSTMSRTGSQSYKAVERNVEERPITAILAAFVAGAAVGWILDRRH